ncbi:MAG TPA: Na(+)/H(+) antiporter subunit B, partial [Kaistia sp.]|nr:Na(+)/H(+) antiporter subunit B [Kaistia sp.]
MRLDVVLRVATKFMLAPLLLFALYVQFHGDYGPGGGFQAGVIAAAAIILYGLINGLGPAQKIVPVGLLEVLIPGGVLIYVAVGVAGMLLGDNFLDYNHLAHDSIHGQE